MARLILQVHVQTTCRVRHAGHEGSCDMSRGLRQGCPLAPILYAAWSGRVCRILMSKLGQPWCSSHLSMFADDILGFWEITSAYSLKRATCELSVLLQVLSASGMTINADKSAAILSLSGTRKHRCIREYTEQNSQSSYLRVSMDGESAHIPLVEVLPYLGVQLSYGRFEAQTLQYRLDKAVAKFNMLSNVLRTNSKFGANNRVRIYKSCVWASMRYGLIATGINQSGFNRIVALICAQLRKVLRVHEHGVSNLQVLAKADLNPMQFFVDNGNALLERICRDESRSEAMLCIEKAAAEENMQLLKSVSVMQPHSSIVEVDPVAAQGGHVCPTCGLAFASEDGLTMHIRHRHVDVHVKAGVEFNRGTHSLFGLSVCRLCRRHLVNWGALHKHITTGTCPRLKDSYAREITHTALLDMVAEEEKINPPQMPAQLPEVQDVGEYAEWMDAPISLVLQDRALHQRLRAGCAICKQRLVGINRIKTHWRLSHQAAWNRVGGTVQGSLRGLRSIFLSPCQFCGSKARDTSKHALQCPVMYQVCAVRELHKLHFLSEARQESKPVQARQDKEAPRYLSFDMSQTPLGRAFGWSERSTRPTCTAQQQTQKAPLKQRPADTASMKVATIRSAPEGGVLSADMLSASAIRLSNPHTLCYMNASILALLHADEVLGTHEEALHVLRQEVDTAQRLMGSARLPALRSFGRIASDAAEFSSHVLSRIEGLGLWQSRIEAVEGIRVTDTGAFVFLPMPTSPSTLQELIEAWTFQHHIYGLTGEWPRIPVVLGRYAGRLKNQARVMFDGDVMLPVFGEGRSLRQARYQVAAALIHLGATPESGHYRALLRCDGSWQYTDDNVPSTSTSLTGEHACNAYLLWLIKRGL